MAHDRQSARERFIEQMGFVTQAEGLPRIAGRILALMIVEREPLSFADIARRLAVSRASVSTNTRLLESLGVIERTARPGDRQDHFAIAESPYERLLEGSTQRLEKARQVVERARRDMAGAAPETRRRLDELAEFYQAMADNLDEVVARYRGRNQA